MKIIEIAQLQRTPAFEGVAASVIEKFLAETPQAKRSYSKGDFIAIEGDVCSRVYLLYSGHVIAHMTGNDGKKLIVEEIKEPCILASGFMFASDNRFPVTAEVSSNEAIVLVFSREKFIKLMQSHAQVLNNFIRAISDRSLLLAQRLKASALQSLRVRLAHFLYEHHKELPTLQLLSERLGVARPSLSRVVSQLVEEGYIVQENRKIHVRDVEKLQKLF